MSLCIIRARTAALWIFSVLFDVSDAEAVLEQAVLDKAPPAAPSRDNTIDAAINERYGVIAVGEENYEASVSYLKLC